MNSLIIRDFFIDFTSKGIFLPIQMAFVSYCAVFPSIQKTRVKKSHDYICLQVDQGHTSIFHSLKKDDVFSLARAKKLFQKMGQA
jgi:hypothetical protein